MEPNYNDLVFDLVIRSLKSQKLLRKCRSICKSWNEIACEVMGQNYEWTIDEGKAKIVASLNLLLQPRKNSEDFRLFPSPFWKIILKAHSFKDADFVDFIRSWTPDLAVIEISLYDCVGEDEDKFERDFTVLQDLLVQCGETTLETLYFRWKNYNPETEDFNLEQIKLSKLKQLIINLDVNATKFFIPIFRQTKLTSLQLMLTKSTPLDLGPLDFESIPSHEVHALPQDNYFLRDSTKLSFQTLKSLFISADENTDPSNVAAVLSKCSNSLEDLNFQRVKFPAHMIPKFPNVWRVLVDQNSLSMLDPDKFPALVTLTLCSSADIKSFFHFGVRNLSYIAIDFLKVDDEEEERNAPFKSDFRKSIQNLGCLFPNVQNFVIKFIPLGMASKWRGSQFADFKELIRNSFPHLKTLEIDGVGVLSSKDDTSVDYRRKCSRIIIHG